MGGLLVILATMSFGVNAAIAICSQLSVSKAIPPSESRFDKYVDAIKEWTFESLASSLRGRPLVRTDFLFG
jgi:hypothetical protein